MEDDVDIMKEQRVAPFIVSAGQVFEDIPGLKGSSFLVLVLMTVGIHLEVLTCYHPAESVGFGFSTSVMKLKPEYQSLPGKEIGQLKRNSMSGIKSY
jgi:hypothetical protein